MQKCSPGFCNILLSVLVCLVAQRLLPVSKTCSTSASWNPSGIQRWLSGTACLSAFFSGLIQGSSALPYCSDPSAQPVRGPGFWNVSSICLCILNQGDQISGYVYHSLRPSHANTFLNILYVYSKTVLTEFVFEYVH